MLLYLVKNWTQVNKSWWKLIIYDNTEKQEKIVPIWLVDAIVVFARVQLTTDVLTACLREKIPVFFVVWNGKYLGKLDSLEVKNVELLYKHIWCALNENCSLKYSKIFIKSKIHNSKIMLKRWQKWSWKVVSVDETIKSLDYYIMEIDRVDNLDSLRWYEWSASKIYFMKWAEFLPANYIWAGRNKRPPRDPLNALLSLGYTLLAQLVHMYIEILGLDPQIGFMHQPKDLRSLLVLDMMEMYRSWMVDDLVLKVLRNNDITKDDFMIDRHSQTPVLLTEDGLRRFVWKFYKEVFKKSDDDIIAEWDDWIKLKHMEKTLEEFKKSLVNDEFKYTWFKLK